MIANIWDFITKFWIEHWAEIIVAFAALCMFAALGWLFNAVSWIGKIFKRKKTTPIPEKICPFVYATSFSDLESRIGYLLPNLHGDLNIPYQHRFPKEMQATFESSIDNERFLILFGRTGIGKTRECIQALYRLEKRLGEPITILFPKTPFTLSFDLPHGVSRNHVVLFIDNLHDPPYYYANADNELGSAIGDFPLWLNKCLSYFSNFADFRVIATARNDLPNRDYSETMRRISPILKEFGVVQKQLLSWHQQNTPELIKAIADWRGVSLTEQSGKLLSEQCASDGSPLYAILAMSHVKKGNLFGLDEVRNLPKTFNALWNDTWNKRIASYPTRVHLFQALSLLNKVGLTPYKHVTMELAAQLWGKPLWWHRRMITHASHSVSAWIEKKDFTFECPESYLPPDIPRSQHEKSILIMETLRVCSEIDLLDMAKELDNLGNFLQQKPLENEPQNLEDAITCYRQALAKQEKYYEGELWGGHLGKLFIDAFSIFGIYSGNIPFDVDSVIVLNHLGDSYRKRILGDRIQNLEMAASCYEDAQELYDMVSTGNEKDEEKAKAINSLEEVNKLLEEIRRK